MCRAVPHLISVTDCGLLVSDPGDGDGRRRPAAPGHGVGRGDHHPGPRRAALRVRVLPRVGVGEPGGQQRGAARQRLPQREYPRSDVCECVCVCVCVCVRGELAVDGWCVEGLESKGRDLLAQLCVKNVQFIRFFIAFHALQMGQFQEDFVVVQDNVMYTIVGVGTAPQFFRIEERTGSIRISQLLKDDELKPANYTVSIWVQERATVHGPHVHKCKSLIVCLCKLCLSKRTRVIDCLREAFKTQDVLSDQQFAT